jgi:hypothetical protein
MLVIQEFLVFLAIFSALLYLIRFFFKKKVVKEKCDGCPSGKSFTSMPNGK